MADLVSTGVRQVPADGHAAAVADKPGSGGHRHRNPDWLVMRLQPDRVITDLVGAYGLQVSVGQVGRQRGTPALTTPPSSGGLHPQRPDQFSASNVVRSAARWRACWETRRSEAPASGRPLASRNRICRVSTPRRRSSSWPVVDQLGGVQGEPLALGQRKPQRQPVGRVDQVLIFDRLPVERGLRAGCKRPAR